MSATQRRERARMDAAWVAAARLAVAQGRIPPPRPVQTPPAALRRRRGGGS